MVIETRAGRAPAVLASRLHNRAHTANSSPCRNQRFPSQSCRLCHRLLISRRCGLRASLHLHQSRQGTAGCHCHPQASRPRRGRSHRNTAAVTAQHHPPPSPPPSSATSRSAAASLPPPSPPPPSPPTHAGACPKPVITARFLYRRRSPPSMRRRRTPSATTSPPLRRRSHRNDITASIAAFRPAAACSRSMRYSTRRWPLWRMKRHGDACSRR